MEITATRLAPCCSANSSWAALSMEAASAVLKMYGAVGSVTSSATEAKTTHGMLAFSISGRAAMLALLQPPPWSMKTRCWKISFLAAAMAVAASQRSSSRTSVILRPFTPPALLTSL